MGRKPQPPISDDIEINTTVDDEAFAELDQLVGQRVIYVHVWDDTIADFVIPERLSAISDGPMKAHPPDSDSQAAYEFDVDLYLEEGVYFELYCVLYYTDPQEEPLADATTIFAEFRTLIRDGLWLDEIAVDEEDGLVLLFRREGAIVLYLVVGAWTLDEWTELPNDTDNT